VAKLKRPGLTGLLPPCGNFNFPLHRKLNARFGSRTVACGRHPVRPRRRGAPSTVTRDVGAIRAFTDPLRVQLTGKSWVQILPEAVLDEDLGLVAVPLVADNPRRVVPDQRFAGGTPGAASNPRNREAGQ